MDRFWAKVDKRPDGCWVWTASRLRAGGYGQFNLNGIPTRAHRLSWEMHNGPIPAGLQVCHTCDNPPCVNPAHLFLGTIKENAHDRDRKGRTHPGWVPGSRNGGAKLTEAQVAEIRERASGATHKALALEFGVSRTLIGLIVNRKQWRHVP